MSHSFGFSRDAAPSKTNSINREGKNVATGCAKPVVPAGSWPRSALGSCRMRLLRLCEGLAWGPGLAGEGATHGGGSWNSPAGFLGGFCTLSMLPARGGDELSRAAGPVCGSPHDAAKAWSACSARAEVLPSGFWRDGTTPCRSAALPHPPPVPDLPISCSQ